MLAEKAALLAAAGAAAGVPPVHCDLRPAADGEAASPAGDQEWVPPRIPLRAGSYSPVVCHMLKGELARALERFGWDPAVPTIWLACET